LLSSGVWSFLNQVTRVASLAFITIALSRHFGPQRFGSFAFGLAFVRIFSVVAAFGLDRVIVRHMVELPEQRSAILRHAFLLKLLIASSSYVLMVIVCAAGLADRVSLAIVAIAGSALLFQAFDAFDFAFQAEHRFREVFFGRGLAILVSAAIKFAALMAGAPLMVFAALETAEAAFDAVTGVIRHGTTMQQIIDAAGVIEDAGFTVYDDLMHGFGGGYFPPVLGSRSRPAGPLPEMTLEAGMTCVVQPNVITPDQKAGVQVGELVLVTETGFERLHRAERGLFRIG